MRNRTPLQTTTTGALVAAALLVMGARAHAAEPATSQLTQLTPTQAPCDSCGRPVAQAASQSLPIAPAPATNSFRLNDLRLNGAEALPAEDLKAVTQPYIGRDVTLGDLEALAQAITAQYRARGYFLATAIVPVQTVQGGVVEISVIEGRLGKVDVIVAPDAPLGEARVRGFLSGLQPGEAVNAPSYERAMLLLSDQPGVRVS